MRTRLMGWGMAGLLFFAGAAGMAAQVDSDINRAANISDRAALERMIRAHSGRGEEDRLIRGIAWHNLGQAFPASESSKSSESEDEAGEDFLAKGFEALEGLDDPLAQAYRGSLMTLQASRAEARGKLMTATGLLDRGFQAMDEAVAGSPENSIIRCLRGVNSLEVSRASPFDRYAQVREDLSWLLTWMDRERDGGEPVSPETKAMILWMEGEMAYRDDRLEEALDAWETAYAAAPDTAYGRRSDDRLWDLEE